METVTDSQVSAFSPGYGSVNSRECRDHMEALDPVLNKIKENMKTYGKQQKQQTNNSNKTTIKHVKRITRKHRS